MATMQISAKKFKNPCQMQERKVADSWRCPAKRFQNIQINVSGAFCAPPGLDRVKVNVARTYQFFIVNDMFSILIP